MDIALIAAIASLVTALSGIVFTVVKLREERRERQQEIKSKTAELEVKFLNERVAERYKSYVEVFRTLGVVRDIPDPLHEHYKSLQENKEQLIDVEKRLLEHLYSHAGLVMGMETRNALLDVWLACQLFRAGKIELRQLVGYFYIARRWLRADLQIVDEKTFTSELSLIEMKYNLEGSNKKIIEARDIGFEL